ncbi:glucokinase [Palleronia sediminis]|uniref:Glucokinase n=1 Tax=Palleronia sediminis TaxID=2547833 RepID=A0A4R6AMD4_9RHOB|nr:glucokinase [Palleronia sediminis]TDL83698.1 glucokinase [Palleronia sediminis]
MTRGLSIVADAGGTNTRVALARGPQVMADTTRRFRNAGFAGLPDILERFLVEAGRPDCAGACVAVAGPVMDGIGRLTNLDWVFDRDDLGRVTGARTVSVLNDLQAQGHALDHIADDCLFPIVPGPEGDPLNAKLVIGVGTGFNSVPVFRTETGRYVPPCETGHMALPSVTDEDHALARFAARRGGYPEVENVVSGSGLETILEFVTEGRRRARSHDIVAALATGDDPEAARAAELFVQALGRVAGDLALATLPFGGIYLVGGMSNAIRPYLSRFGFDEAFRAKGRFTDFMDRFAVWGVEDDYAALTGCAQHVAGLMNEARPA